MKKILLSFLFLVLASALFSQEADLMYKCKENAHHKFKEKTVFTFNADVMGNNVSSTAETLVDIDETVLSVGDKMKIKQISTVVSSSLDGKDTLDKIPEKERVNTAIYETDKRGKILSLEFEEKNDSDIDLSEEMPLFPDRKVKIGDEWDWKKTIDGVNVKAKCRLLKLYSKDGVDIAEISIVFDDEITEKEENDNMNTKTNVKGKGVFYYAVNYGNDLYMYYDVDFETVMSSEKGEAKLSSNYKQTYWRCE